MCSVLDSENDVAYVVLTDDLRDDGDGWSQMLLPPDVPVRVDLFSGRPTTGAAW